MIFRRILSLHIVIELIAEFSLLVTGAILLFTIDESLIEHNYNADKFTIFSPLS
jgi:hypothetical protein